MNRKGQLGNIFAAVVSLIILAFLIVIAITLFSSFSSKLEPSMAINSSSVFQSPNFKSQGLLGIIVIITFSGITIGLLIRLFASGDNSSNDTEEYYEDEEDESEDEEPVKRIKNNVLFGKEPEKIVKADKIKDYTPQITSEKDLIKTKYD